MSIKAVIFDLDGVILSTDMFHYKAWKKLADEEEIDFDETINERLRGVSRMESLDILLEISSKEYSQKEKEILAERKNEYYREYINELTEEDILPGVMDSMATLKKKGIMVAIGSSSKNSPKILQLLGLEIYFDATADGNEITHSKPDPEVFLLAAQKLGVEAVNCLVVEDAEAGIEAALRAKMKVLAVGAAYTSGIAHYRSFSLIDVSITDLIV